MSTSLAWDERYAGGGFQFGEAPNFYLESLAPRLRPGMRALALGDGEGRNGAWLAAQGLAVTSLDWSPVGSAKAAALAARRGVAMECVTTDASAWDYPEAGFDLVAWIYLHLPPADRAAAAAGVVRALAPGGMLALECFTPAQQGRRSGGPKMADLLWSRAIVEDLFGGLEVLELLEGTVRLDEGPRHQGPAEVVRALLRKPG
ncbi:methyltransferase domain-containing protein [Falsiroseomonas stagni]|uniref:Methyltransferase domain-containing protein n=1 Tax=Falsiroseomonas stagni DSM 19981 TaxID=1123062 RepID=A0A1I3XNL1_9PROT|nr:methyltransferase domain-containing protein [Falsiroseomonas stagni]SFK20586.1 Methyltransferase domain-containing protein [Falsiroseomonas stagni DSM 19981]